MTEIDPARPKLMSRLGADGTPPGADARWDRHRPLPGRVNFRPAPRMQDLLAPDERTPEQRLSLLLDLVNQPSWSCAYAAFLLNGFQLDQADADDTLDRLVRLREPGPLGERILAAHDQMTTQLQPRHMAPPREILWLMTGWSSDIRPQSPMFLWEALDIAREENARLTALLSKARKVFDGEMAAGRRRLPSQSTRSRLQIYMAVLAQTHFGIRGNPTKLGTLVVSLLERTIGEGHRFAGGRLTIVESARMTALIKEGLELAGLEGSDGKRGPKGGREERPAKIRI